MKPVRTSLPLFQFFLFLLISSTLYAQGVPTPKTAQFRGGQAIQFTPNKGQIVDTDGELRPEIRYVTHSKGLSLYLSDNRLSYVFTMVEGDMEHHKHADGFYDRHWAGMC